MGTEQSGVVQQPPRLRDEWRDDRVLRAYLRRSVPDEVRAAIEPELAEMGALAATDLHEWSNEMDQRRHEPRLIRFDAWGRRVDRVEVSPVWERIGAVAHERGVIAAGYQPTHGPWRRVHQYALAYLYSPSSALYSCPLAMTDGAVKTLLEHGDPDLVDRAVPRLTSRDPARAWTSGQWMTERTGGSDVGISETQAVKDGQVWRLTGTKWFTSAVTADMALTLARPEGNPMGGRGLAMFYVEVRGEDGRLNDLRILRLKDKLGTRQMPTAELALEGTVAHLVGSPSDGTRNITPMLAITRLWNAVSATGGMRRAYALARDYATRRVAFGRHLIDQPLHQTTLAWMLAEYAAALQLTLRAAELLGRIEDGSATDADQRLFRLLLPLTKLVTGKQAVAVASEGLEAFGGAGYVEDTHLPVLLRDAQVLPIWEGTTNVLSLDALRARRSEGTVVAYLAEVRRAAQTARAPALVRIAERALSAVEHGAAWIDAALAQAPETAEHGARRWALTLGRSLQAALLVEQAQHDLDAAGDGRGVAVAARFASAPLDLIEEEPALAADAALVREEPLDLG